MCIDYIIDCAGCHAPELIAATKFKTTKINFWGLFGLSTKITRYTGIISHVCTYNHDNEFGYVRTKKPARSARHRRTALAPRSRTYTIIPGTRTHIWVGQYYAQNVIKPDL